MVKQKDKRLTDRQIATMVDQALTKELKFEETNIKKLSLKYGIPANLVQQLKKKLKPGWDLAYDNTSLVTLMKMNEDPARNIYKLRVKQLGGKSVYCRSQSSDKFVLHSTFNVKFHLPPAALIPTGKATILDLGGNVGYTMAHYKYLYPKARVIGVEMDEDNFNVLKMNMDQFKNWDALNGAVWTTNGSIDYSGKDEETLAIHDIDPVNDALELPKRSVTSYTIQSIIDKYQLDSVDFMKMDIEGAEIAIFNDDLGWTSRIQSMHVEVHNPEKNPERIDYTPAIMEKARDAGFVCVKDERHWSAFFAHR